MENQAAFNSIVHIQGSIFCQLQISITTLLCMGHFGFGFWNLSSNPKMCTLSLSGCIDLLAVCFCLRINHITVL